MKHIETELATQTMDRLYKADTMTLDPNVQDRKKGFTLRELCRAVDSQKNMLYAATDSVHGECFLSYALIFYKTM